MPGPLRSALVRILQVHNQYREPGGEDRVVGAEYELLKSAGHEVFTHRVTNPTSGVQAAGMLLLSPNNPGAARAVRRLAAEFRPDVAHVHNTWFSLSPSVLGALQKMGVPVVVTLHNYRLMCVNSLLFRDGRPCEDCVGSHPWHGVLHRCYRDSALASAAAAGAVTINRARSVWSRHVDRFLVLSQFSRGRFAAAGIPDDRMTTVSNFVDDPGPRLSSPAASNMVLFVGRLSAEKGADLMLSAWPRTGGLKLVVVGDGPLRSELEHRAGSSVSFLGYRSPAEVRSLMLRSRALVFPSLAYENQPVVLLEAMSAGLPVVASGSGAIPEVFAGSPDVKLVAAGDREAWAAALLELSEGRFVATAGASMRALYEKRYTPNASRAALETVYENVINQRRR
jgi:glycosyltransferase involved in cell wall biosynthesis